MTDTINNGIPFVPENTIDPAAGLNLSLLTLDAQVQLAVESVGLNTPPASPAQGARYIVGTAPTGAWAGQANALAMYLDTAWRFYAARYALNKADGRIYLRTGTTWAAGGDATWGGITGTLSAQADLQGALDAKQPLDATLTALAGVTTAADQLIYATGADTFNTATLTAQARALLDDATPLGMRSTLELVKQTSAIDTTAGSLMSVGAFGLGTYDLPTASDIDAIRPTQVVKVVGDAVGNPFIGTGCTVLCSAESLTWGWQLASANGGTITTPLKYRLKSGSTTWTPWRDVYDQGNILGSVAQSGGVPTGAIIERGSNANGEYVRFADGTQICWARLVSEGGLQTWTFPATFAGGTLVVTGNNISDASRVVSFFTPSTTGVNLVLFDTVTGVATPAGFNLYALAHGRWF